MKYIKKHIITGAPGTGKSTLTSELEKEFPCMHEVSRKVIIKEQESGGDGMPWQNLGRFAQLVFDTFIQELVLNHKAVFTDRFILDLIAYFDLEGKPIPSYLAQYPYQDQFSDKVFFAPTWEEIFHKDDQRQQEYAYCLELEKVLLTTYKEKGFDIVHLPNSPVSDRVSFIKKHLV
ncbi:AAA family ATPase [Reichenbachiella versicolor]|uniref:AAA family ATPase n=1 Tax=Reichenbachiella versicolor TaxID=1821036 RepID=UPI0013A54D5F|nr:AAA family ATPase [Reichenbachiella versicolor]